MTSPPLTSPTESVGEVDGSGKKKKKRKYVKRKAEAAIAAVAAAMATGPNQSSDQQPDGCYGAPVATAAMGVPAEAPGSFQGPCCVENGLLAAKFVNVLSNLTVVFILWH